MNQNTYTDTNIEQNVYTDDDFDKLENNFKNSCLVMVPESEIINFTISNYVNSILKKYDERLDVEPYIEATLKEVEEDYANYSDCFEDINEFARKIYGGYIKGDHIYSTINYDAEWSYYKIMQTYNSDKIENLNLSIKVKSIIDLDKNIHKKSNDESDQEWTNKMNNLISKFNSNDDLFLAHVEYF